MSKLDKVLLIRANLPPLERYCLFHIASLLWTLFDQSQTNSDLKEAEVSSGKMPSLQPNKQTNSSMLATHLTGN